MLWTVRRRGEFVFGVVESPTGRKIPAACLRKLLPNGSCIAQCAAYCWDAKRFRRRAAEINRPGLENC